MTRLRRDRKPLQILRMNFFDFNSSTLLWRTLQALNMRLDAVIEMVQVRRLQLCALTFD